MNEEPKPVQEPEPAPDPNGPAAYPPVGRPGKYGRVPKDVRGDRNKRKRGQAIQSLVNWGK